MTGAAWASEPCPVAASPSTAAGVPSTKTRVFPPPMIGPPAESRTVRAMPLIAPSSSFRHLQDLVDAPDERTRTGQVGQAELVAHLTILLLNEAGQIALGAGSRFGQQARQLGATGTDGAEVVASPAAGAGTCMRRAAWRDQRAPAWI